MQRALERSGGGLGAEAGGALDAVEQLTAKNLRTRGQFGARRAKFQTLQHRVADMAMAVEQLKSMACAGALALQADDAAERRLLPSGAKALTAGLARRCAVPALQLHRCQGHPLLTNNLELLRANT